MLSGSRGLEIKVAQLSFRVRSLQLECWGCRGRMGFRGLGLA